MNAQVFTILQITYTVCFPLVIGWVSGRLKEREANSNSGKKADCLLLRKALIDIHDASMAQGYISQPSYQAFEDIWKLYHEAYNGNTLTDKFRDEIQKLDIK